MSSDESTSDAKLSALLAAGRHADAAELFLTRGKPAEAADLLAKVWRWAEAVSVTRDAGLFDEAYRHAIQSGDRALVVGVLPELEARPEQAARAAEHARARGLPADAGRLLEAAGEAAAAADAYEEAGDLADAARLREEAGDARGAGMLWEKRLAQDPEDAEAAMALGRILVSFGRWEHAARALQRAAAHERYLASATRLLVATFEAMGMREAAQSRLDALRAAPSERDALPSTVPEFLQQAFGDPRGLRAGRSDKLLLGRYRVVKRLGAGATGRVLLVEDAFHNRQVAVKVLTASGGAGGRDALLRFAREARVAAGIDHASVVRVHDYHPEGPFLVMEYMGGGTLEERLGGETPTHLPPAVVHHVARSILAALEAVHRRGVIHRDLKPANVFFGEAGEVKLGDFGVAHLSDLGQTMTGGLIGTLAYMAPEQITGASRPDASTDLYALGILMFRALCGRLPFPGPDFALQHLEGVAPAPSSLAPWLSSPFDAFIARLLEKAQSDRPRTATEVLEALGALPWREAQEAESLREAGAQAPRDRVVSEPPPAPEEERFVVVETRDDGVRVARDVLLERSVLLVPCDAARAARLRALSAADSPFLQAVFGVDEARGEAVLELPAGARPRGELSAEILEELETALRAMHARGLAHGRIDRDHVLLAPGRAVLLLPEQPATDLEADRRALRGLGQSA